MNTQDSESRKPTEAGSFPLRPCSLRPKEYNFRGSLFSLISFVLPFVLKKRAGNGIRTRVFARRLVPSVAPLHDSRKTQESPRTLAIVQNPMNPITLVIKLNDGRELSGTYPYLAALARLDEARKWPLFKDFELLPA